MSDAGRDRAARRPWWRPLTSVRARLVMSLGLLVGFGAVGTSAFWVDQEPLEVGTVTAGSLDLQLGPDLTTHLLDGPGGTWSFSVVELADVAPGESVAKDIVFTNGGTTPLNLTGTAFSTTNEFGSHLTITTRRSGTARNVGTKNTVDRTGSCDGGDLNWWTNLVLTTAPVQVIQNQTPAQVALAPGEQLRVCMLVRFSAGAPSALQGASTTIKASFVAVQPSA